MTEDDTFRVLRRTPFDTVFWEAPWLSSAPDHLPLWDKFLQPHHWTRKEYFIEMNKRYPQK